MPRKNNKTKHQKTKDNVGWELALERAEDALYKNKFRRSQIMKAIKFFRSMIEKGVPWPTKR
jgi:hypothetical protein